MDHWQPVQGICRIFFFFGFSSKQSYSNPMNFIYSCYNHWLQCQYIFVALLKWSFVNVKSITYSEMVVHLNWLTGLGEYSVDLSFMDELRGQQLKGSCRKFAKCNLADATNMWKGGSGQMRPKSLFFWPGVKHCDRKTLHITLHHLKKQTEMTGRWVEEKSKKKVT